MTEHPAQTVAIGLGSNIGDRLAALRAALQAMPPYIDITATSPVYETAPAYVRDQAAFLNAAVIGTTRLEPLALLWTLKDIENTLGRQPTFRYGPRIIDLDILFYGDRIMATPELSLPHNHLAERDFVLRPLCDIAPDLVHPVSGATVADMLARLPPGAMPCLGAVL